MLGNRMDRVHVCYVDTEPTAARADISALSNRAISVQTVGSVHAACELLESGSVGCLLAEWIPSKADRQPLLECCRRGDIAVVWITDEPTAVIETLEADRTEYISTADAACGSLLAHRIRSTVAATQRHHTADEQPPNNQTRHDADEPSLNSTSGYENRPARPSSNAIVEQSQAGILVFDADGKITQLNPAAEAILELPAADAIGNSCKGLDMRLPNNEPLSHSDRPVARVLDTGEPIQKAVVSIPDSTGGRRWLSISGSPLANGQTVTGVVVTLEDISTAVELESTLETVLERMTDGFVAFDTDLRLTYASTEAIDTDCYSLDEYLGSQLSELGGLLTQYEPDLQEVLDTQTSKTVETHVPEPTDEWIRARLYPSETGVSVFFHEITDEKQRERELEQYKTIVESVRDGVCILDSHLQFVLVNDAFCELAGYDEAELLGRNAAVVTDLEDMQFAEEGRKQLFDGNSESVILSGEITANDGERIPVETWMTPIELLDGTMGTVGVVRDLSYRKNTEAMFTALYDVAHELLSARSNEEIAEIGAKAATSVLGFEDAIVFSYDEQTNDLRPLAHTPGTETNVPGLAPIAVEATSIAGQAFFESELIVTEDLSELPTEYDSETPYRRVMFIPLAEHGVLFVGDIKTDSTSDQTLTVAELLGATVAAAFSRLASEQQSLAHRQTVAEQTEELEALSHTNALVEAFGDRLFSAQSRQEVETVVCSVLADFEPYRFAWIGAAESRDEALRTRASVGYDDGYLDWLGQQFTNSENSEAADAGAEPTARAFATNTPGSVDRIAEHWQTEPWRKEALSRGFQSVFSIPLRHNDISYGVLSVYAETPAAFDTYTKRILSEFGRIIAYVITATETKHGLLSDQQTELELEITDGHDLLHRLAERLGTLLCFEGVIPQSNNHSLLFFSVDDLAQPVVEAAAAELCSVESLRLVTVQNGTGLYEASVSGDVLAATLVDCGAIPTTVETDGDRLRAVVTLPQSTSVRTFTERLKSEYPSTTVISRQDRDHSPQTRETFQMQLYESLTDRQKETLRAAYFARYFDSPRASTGTEVGTSLGISQPTFNYHLRAALRTLLGLLFEDAETLDE